MARVPYLDREDLREADRSIFDRIASTRGAAEPDMPMPNSFRALLNSPGAAEAVGRLGEYVRFESPLDPVAREIAILSVARQTNSDYEWAHHESVARSVGVSDQVIESIRTGRAPMGIPAKDGIFAQAAYVECTDEADDRDVPVPGLVDGHLHRELGDHVAEGPITGHQGGRRGLDDYLGPCIGHKEAVPDLRHIAG